MTLTATVSSAPATTTGYVTFKNGTASLGGVTLVGGVASLTTSTLGAGTSSITAVYAGSTNFAGSTSPILSQVVSQGTTTVTLTSSSNPSAYGQPVTLTATVSSAAGTPTGYVTFNNGSAWLGNVTLAGGVATFITAPLGVGTRSFTAVYAGGTNFAGSNSSVLTQAVGQAPSAVALTSSQNSSTYGQAVTLTATVSSASGTPTGYVTFKNGTASLGGVALVGGVASLTTSTLGVGTLSLTAVYAGSTNYFGSGSSVLSQVVSQAPSTVALTSSLNPSTYGQAVTLTATVSAASGPTGYVIFKNGTESLGGVALVGGVASLTTSTLGVGTLSITAVYPGTPFFAGSTSPTLTQVVAQADSTVALVSSLNPSTYGQAVTLTATVSSASGTPAGYVTFSAGNTWLGNVTLAGGVANFTTTTLAAGTLPITAVYPGTANFSAGSASMMQQVMPVVAHDYALTATALNPGFVIAGNASASTVTVTPENGYTGSVRLSCSVIIGGSPAPTCVFNPSSVTISDINPGTATLTVSTSSSTPAGNDSILVSAGDSNNLAPINGSQTLMLATVPAGSLGYGLTTTALNPGFVTPGTSSTAAVTVTPLNGYTGSISLSCSVTSGGGPAPNCAFNPPSVTISDINPGTATLAVSTASSTPAGNDSISVSAVDANNLPPVNGPQTLTLATAVIQHIVIIFQENRTPDNLFQDPVLISRGADIVGSGMNSLGQAIPLSPIDLGFAGVNPNNYDLGHNHQSFVSMYDGGKMDGADLIYCNPTAPAQCPPNAQFMYVNPADVQPYFALAEQYTFGDRMFQTNQGPSFPSHQFIISGTSAPTAGSPLFAAENPTLNNAGCIAPLSTLVTMIDATGSETNPAPQYPCFEHATLTDLLDANGLTWHYYTPAPGSIWTGPDAIEHICQEQPINGILTCTGPDWNNNVIIPQTQVLTDIANGQLPQVSWVIPNGTSSDHAAINDGSGPSWVASVVNAIGNSSYWANTAIIITWDDWGGWYDHVAPTVINDGVSWGSGNVYGFRVPLIVVSPYAKAGYVSHVTHDFGSILKFIENNFNLPSLGYADGPADNLADCFDFTQTPSSFQAIPAPLGALDFINDKRPPTAPDDD